MTPLEWAVVMGGVAAILWVNWYFFVADGAAEGRKRRDQGPGTGDQ